MKRFLVGVSLVGRGIIILAHSSVNHLVIDIHSPVEFDEVAIVEIRLTGKDILALACIYRSPTNHTNSKDNNNNLNRLIRTLSEDKRYSHKCIVGDFNFPTINWKNWTTPHMEESKEEQFLEALRDSFLFQHVDEPTRCRGADEPSLIDLILTSENNQISDMKFLSPLGKSDHSVLVFSFKCYAELKATSKRFIYHSADFFVQSSLSS